MEEGTIDIECTIDATAFERTENKEYIRKTKPASDWWKENNPCPKCEINKKDHWDDIHYNCELCHAQRCPILKEAQKKYDVIFKKCLNSCHKKL